MADETLSQKLWTHRTAEETREIYAEWAKTYDADVTGAGYMTPRRVAAALAAHLTDKSAPILDFGCGTGLSGVALANAGFLSIDGTDITAEMLQIAGDTGVYRKLFQSMPGVLDWFTPGDYTAISAIGAISLGAAPPETLSIVAEALAPGGLLALSLNDVSLQDSTYRDALSNARQDSLDLVFEEYGPHLIQKEMGSCVYVLQKR